MSIDRGVYLGPFAKCKPLAKTVVETYRFCQECNSRISFGVQFCGRHGKGEDRTEEKIGSSRRDIVDVACNEGRLTELTLCGEPVIDDFTCLAPNQDMDGKRRKHFDPECPDEYVFAFEDPSQLARERSQFEAECAAELAEIRPLCESVEIVWGLVFTAN